MALFLLLFVLVPFLVGAKTSSSVVINEIAWMGSFVDKVDVNQHWRYEWLELHNTKDVPFQVAGWSIELYRGEELYFQIPLQGIIPRNGYLLVGASDKIANLDINYANLGGKLVNTGMKIVLKDAARNIADEVDAREGWSAGNNETKRTMERKAESDPALWQTSAKVGGTPKSQNSEGLKELVASFSFSATKKDLKRSSQDSFNVLSGTTLLAVLLALGSSVGILGLRRYLARLEQG